MKKFRAPFLFTMLIIVALYHQYSTGQFYRYEVKQMLNKHNTVVVMYTASWCPACKKLKPVLERMQGVGLIGLKVLDIDKDEFKQTGAIIDFVPTITVYRNKGEVRKGIAYHGLMFKDAKDMFDVFFLGDDIDIEALIKSLGNYYAVDTEI